MKYYTSLFKGIIEKRKLIWDLSKADFKKRFVGSYFGVIWMFIQPLVTILIYAFLFGEYGFKSPPPVPGASYVIWMVPGIVPWFYFSEALNTGTNCLQEYHYLVKKVVFQVEMLPIIKMISCFHGTCLFLSYHGRTLSGWGTFSDYHLDSGALLLVCGVHAGAGSDVPDQFDSGVL